LTEIAFLEIRSTVSTRKAEEKRRIIPINLNRDGIKSYLFAINSTDLYLKLTTESNSIIHESQHAHKLLFNLLSQMYPHTQDYIKEFNDCYNKYAKLLSYIEPQLSDKYLEEKVSSEITYIVTRLTRRNHIIHNS